MKKNILSIFIIFCSACVAKAQVLPTFQFGIKGGLNLGGISVPVGNTFTANNQAGYIGGLWARFGALGFNFQPELYYASKSVNVTSNGGETRATFNSINMPLLFGTKIGAAGLGARVYTGPVISFAINKDQSFGGALQQATSLNYRDQNFAWQFGTGFDMHAVSIDLRYEAGITKQTYGYVNTHINLFSLAVAYRLVKL